MWFLLKIAAFYSNSQFALTNSGSTNDGSEKNTLVWITFLKFIRKNCIIYSIYIITGVYKNNIKII